MTVEEAIKELGTFPLHMELKLEVDGRDEILLLDPNFILDEATRQVVIY